MKCLHCDTEMEIYESDYGTEMVKCSGCGYNGTLEWLEPIGDSVERMLKEWFQRIEEFPEETKTLLVREAAKGPVFKTKHFSDFCMRNTKLFDNPEVTKVLNLMSRMEAIQNRLEILDKEKNEKNI